MKKLVKGFVMSASMFSIIPLPASFWNDESMPYVVPFFPVVGAGIGGLWYAFIYLLTTLTDSYIKASFLTAAGIMLFPFLLSGFIHTDGFLDTADAVFSRRSKEEKLKILKDPNVGAFAAISLVVLMLVSFCAVFDSLPYLHEPSPVFIFLPVISRCVSGYALLVLKPVSENGYASMFKNGTGARHRTVVLIIAVAALILSFASGGIKTMAVVLAAAVSGVVSVIFLSKQFGGITGDLCGAAVTFAELAGIVCFAII